MTLQTLDAVVWKIETTLEALAGESVAQTAEAEIQLICEQEIRSVEQKGRFETLALLWPPELTERSKSLCWVYFGRDPGGVLAW
jgi:hypothetical protein